MKRIILNGKRMITRDVTHAYLKRKFDLPDWYGKNLDALWDLLSTELKDTEIVIIHKNRMMESLGGYGVSIVNLFKDLEDGRGRVKVTCLG